MKRISKRSYVRPRLFLLVLMLYLSVQHSVVLFAQDLAVTVKSGDTLSRIGWRLTGIQEEYIWQKIASFNNLDPEQPLVVGSTILIPAELLAAAPVSTGQVRWTEQLAISEPIDTVNNSDFKEKSLVDREKNETEYDETTEELSAKSEATENLLNREAVEGPVIPEVVAETKPARPQQTQPEQPEQSEQADASVQQAGVEQSARSPGLFDVDEDAAARALERSLVQLDALLLEKWSVELGLDYTYSYDSTSEPVLIQTTVDTEDGSSETRDSIAIFEDNSTQQALVLGFKMGLPGDAQVSLAWPYEILSEDSAARVGGISVDSESQSLSDFGDYSIGLTKALFYEKGLRPDVLFNVTYDGNSGHDSNTLRTGSGADEIAIGLNATKRQDPLVFTFAAAHTISEKVDGLKAGAVTTLSVGSLLAASPYTSLLFEFDQTFVAEASLDGVSIKDTDASVGSVAIGASSVISRSLFLSSALRFGLTEKATDYLFSLGLSLRLGN